MKYSDFGLIITSHPHSFLYHEAVKETGIPTIILSDRIDKELIDILEGFDKFPSYCMIKPIDYEKFKTLIKRLLSNEINEPGGYNIV